MGAGEGNAPSHHLTCVCWYGYGDIGGGGGRSGPPSDPFRELLMGLEYPGAPTEGSGPPRELRLPSREPRPPPKLPPKDKPPEPPWTEGSEWGGVEAPPPVSVRETGSPRGVGGGMWAVGGEIAGMGRMGSVRAVSGGGDGAERGARGR